MGISFGASFSLQKYTGGTDDFFHTHVPFQKCWPCVIQIMEQLLAVPKRTLPPPNEG